MHYFVISRFLLMTEKTRPRWCGLKERRKICGKYGEESDFCDAAPIRRTYAGSNNVCCCYVGAAVWSNKL
jgi:hypothetical protein